MVGDCRRPAADTVLRDAGGRRAPSRLYQVRASCGKQIHSDRETVVTAGANLSIARVIAGAASLLVLVSACSIPSRPVWWPKPKPMASHLSVAAGHKKVKVDA